MLILNANNWSKAIARPAQEFISTNLPIISGQIPQELTGTLYRNGPARLVRGSDRVGHWFDGDGAILRVNFAQTATATYRYVQTQGYQQESQADALIYPNYGRTATGGFWNNWFKPVKNAANTSVLALEDRLLALWEGGLPHTLDLETLSTQGLHYLSPLSTQQPFSAHPKVDPQTGEIYNFGVIPGLNSTLNIYRCDCQGKAKREAPFMLKGLPLIHDFAIAGKYLVFLVAPVRINLLPVILGQKSFSDAMEWKPELGTEILIFDKEDLSLISRSQTEPWYQWHFSNGYVDKSGKIIVEFVRYEDFQTNQYLKEVATGKTTTKAKGTLWELAIDPKTAKIMAIQEVCPHSCEFPVVPQHQQGKLWRYSYLSVHRRETDIGRELLNSIALFDRISGNLTMADIEDGCYPSEPIYAPHPQNPDTGWILTVVYDSRIDRSEIRIYQRDRLDEDPSCRLALPSVIPPGFHGTWRSSSL
jgi:all-trans-8'-apo-beta-carotenal 15,15'-oxygenase